MSTTPKMNNFDKFRGRLSNSQQPIYSKFELDLCFYVIILILKFHNDPLNIVRDIAPTTLKMINFDKFRGR